MSEQVENVRRIREQLGEIESASVEAQEAMQRARKRDRATRDIIERASVSVGSMEERIRRMEADKEMLMLTLDSTYKRITDALEVISNNLKGATEALKQSEADVAAEIGWSGAGLEQIIVSKKAREYYAATLTSKANNAYHSTNGNMDAKSKAVKDVFDAEEVKLVEAQAALSSVFGQETNDPLIALAQRLNAEDLKNLAEVRRMAEERLANDGIIATDSRRKTASKRPRKQSTPEPQVESLGDISAKEKEDDDMEFDEI